MIDIILITIGLLGLLIATITDIKTREIPDWLSYGLIITGFTIRLLHSLIYKDFIPLVYVAIAFVTIFSLSNILYYTKQWGGGDAKILMALSTFFATKPTFLPATQLPFFLILVINIFLIGAIYGLIYGSILAIKKRKRFQEELIHTLRQRKIKTLTKFTLIITLLWITLTFIIKYPITKLIFIFLAILSPFYLLLWICTKTIEKISMYKRRSVDKVRLGDWLADDIIYRGELIIKRKPEGLTNFDIKRLQYHKIKTIVIKEGIPFLPPFLIATILTLLNNKFLFLF